jgi:hypothetical protein
MQLIIGIRVTGYQIKKMKDNMLKYTELIACRIERKMTGQTRG